MVSLGSWVFVGGFGGVGGFCWENSSVFGGFSSWSRDSWLEISSSWFSWRSSGSSVIFGVPVAPRWSRSSEMFWDRAAEVISAEVGFNVLWWV